MAVEVPDVSEWRRADHQWRQTSKGDWFDQSGQSISEFPLGNYVQDVQIDRLGRVWASYFDQKGYGVPALVCFDENGIRSRRLQMMSDAYALNAGSRFTYLLATQTLTSGEIDKDFGFKKRTTPIRGAHAVAVGRAVLFSRQYDEESGVAHLLRMSGASLVEHNIVQLERPDGRPLGEHAAFVGRGHLLCCFDNEQWLCADIHAVLDA
ncbi:MAG: hypothetical protein IPG56_18215 [Caulobacteraceae bacterium]|nr:hypothetical protein [Caulobacteraceae bacterium]